jgi:hypothetical protein
MKFDYLEIPSRDPGKQSARRPYIPIRILYGNKFQDLLCLVDSGADLCLFPAKIGELLGIDIERGKKEQIGGIAETSIVAYIHPVRLIVRGLSGVDVEAGLQHQGELERDYWDKEDSSTNIESRFKNPGIGST